MSEPAKTDKGDEKENYKRKDYDSKTTTCQQKVSERPNRQAMSIIVQLLSFLLLLINYYYCYYNYYYYHIKFFGDFCRQSIKKGLNPSPSLSFVAKDDWKQFE